MDEQDAVIQALHDSPTITVLSIDGGGVRGVAAAAFLRRMEERLGVDAGRFFDYYAGSSSGGLIALHLTVNHQTAGDAVSLFDDDRLKRIMPKTFLTRWMPALIFRPKYDGTGKTEVLKEVFGNRKMQDARRPVMVTAVDMARHRVWVYKSLGGKATAQAPYAWQAADATSAAPIYYPPVTVNGTVYPRYLIDGGVSSNNPSMTLLAELLKLDCRPDQIRMLSLGTGIKSNDIQSEASLAAKAKRWGVLKWLQNGLVDQLMDGSVSGVSHMCRQILGTGYLRINGPLGDISTALDDTRPSNIEKLIKMGERWFDENEQEIRSLLAPQLQALAKLRNNAAGTTPDLKARHDAVLAFDPPQEVF